MTEYYRLNVNQLWQIADQNNLRKLQAKDNYITSKQMFQYETANPTGQVMPVSSGPLDGGIINQWDGDLMRLEYVIERENINYETSQLNGTADLEPVNFETIPVQVKTDIFKIMNVLYRECQKLFSSPQVGEGDILNIFKFYNDFANLYDTYLMDIKQDPIFKNHFNARVVELESIFQKIKTRIQSWGAGNQYENNIFTSAFSYPSEYLESRIRDIIYSLNEMLQTKNIGYFINDTKAPTVQYSQITAQPTETNILVENKDGEEEGDEEGGLSAEVIIDDANRQRAEDALRDMGITTVDNTDVLNAELQEQGQSGVGTSALSVISPRKTVGDYTVIGRLLNAFDKSVKNLSEETDEGKKDEYFREGDEILKRLSSEFKYSQDVIDRIVSETLQKYGLKKKEEEAEADEEAEEGKEGAEAVIPPVDNSPRFSDATDKNGNFLFLKKSELKQDLIKLANYYKELIIVNGDVINKSIDDTEYLKFIRTKIKPYLTAQKDYNKTIVSTPMTKLKDITLYKKLEPNKKFNGEFYQYLSSVIESPENSHINVFNDKIINILSGKIYDQTIPSALLSNFPTRAKEWLIV